MFPVLHPELGSPLRGSAVCSQLPVCSFSVRRSRLTPRTLRQFVVRVKRWPCDGGHSADHQRNGLVKHPHGVGEPNPIRVATTHDGKHHVRQVPDELPLLVIKVILSNRGLPEPLTTLAGDARGLRLTTDLIGGHAKRTLVHSRLESPVLRVIPRSQDKVLLERLVLLALKHTSSGVLDNLFGETSRGLRVGQLLSGFRARLDVRAAGPTNGRKNLVEDPRLELLNALTHNRVLDAPGLTLADSPVEATLGEGVNALVTAGGGN